MILNRIGQILGWFWRKPQVGVAVLLVNRSGEVCLAKRLKKIGYGKLSVPGGHLELFESIAYAAYRETLEETGLLIDMHSVTPLEVVESLYHEKGRHYVVSFVAARLAPFENSHPQNREPDKQEDWFWVKPSDIDLEEMWESSDVLSYKPDRFNAFVNKCKEDGYIAD
jgi:8-oxo-dGTP diphosphatase